MKTVGEVGSAAAKVIPSLKGKLTANAVRVPTPNVSLATLSLNIDKETTNTLSITYVISN